MSGLALVAIAIDAAGSAIIAVAALRAAWRFFATGGSPSAADGQRRALASGILLALSCKTGAGLVRSATLQAWSPLGRFAAILALRVLLGRVAHRAAAAAAAGRDSARS